MSSLTKPVHRRVTHIVSALLGCLGPALLVAVPTAPAALLEKVIDTITAEQLLDFMDNEGYAVELNESGFVQWKLDGFRCQIFVAKDNESIQFHSSFGDGNATLKRINAWNSTKRYSRTYLDDDGDPHLELDLDMCGGVTLDRIRDFLKTCKVSFPAWRTEVLE